MLTISAVSVPSVENSAFVVSFVESGLWLPGLYESHDLAQDGMVSYARKRVTAIDAHYASRTDAEGNPVTKGRRSNADKTEYDAMSAIVNEIVVDRQKETWILEFLAENNMTLDEFQTLRMGGDSAPVTEEVVEPVAPARRNSRRKASEVEDSGEELQVLTS